MNHPGEGQREPENFSSHEEGLIDRETQPRSRLLTETKTMVSYIFQSTSPLWSIFPFLISTAAPHYSQMRKAQGEKVSIEAPRNTGECFSNEELYKL